MNNQSLQFIKDNWELLLSPNAQEFEALFMRSPLKTPWLMIQELERSEKAAISLQGFSELLEIHSNTIGAVFRALEGKIFIGFDIGNEVEVELIEAMKVRYVEKVLAQGSLKAANQQSQYIRGIITGKAHYRFQEQKNGRYIFCDRDVNYVEISSPVQEPWNQEWNISFLRQNMKSSRDRNKKRWPYKLIIKLDQPTPNTKAIALERRRVKSIYAYGDYNPIQFFGCPTSEEKQWVFYSIFEHSKAPQRKG